MYAVLVRVQVVVRSRQLFIPCKNDEKTLWILPRYIVSYDKKSGYTGYKDRHSDLDRVQQAVLSVAYSCLLYTDTPTLYVTMYYLIVCAVFVCALRMCAYEMRTCFRSPIDYW